LEQRFLSIDMNFTSRIALLIAILALAPLAHPSDRTDFAHAYFGLGVQQVPSGKSQVLNGASFEDYDIPSRRNVHLLIGGLHFWNHVDFEISFLLNGEKESDGIKTFVNHVSSAGFATHIYPLALTPYKIRPFIGLGLNGHVQYK
jgi:hypothetical protein